MVYVNISGFSVWSIWNQDYRAHYPLVRGDIVYSCGCEFTEEVRDSEAGKRQKYNFSDIQ